MNSITHFPSQKNSPFEGQSKNSLTNQDSGSTSPACNKKSAATLSNVQLPFTKMHGCGNDYIYFDCFKLEINAPQSLSVLLSDRHTGIGGDGIVLILPSLVADAKMRMFNLDGSEGSMCGNAIRCVAKYLYDNKLVTKKQMSIETLSGIKQLSLFIQKEQVCSVKVDMGKAVFEPSKIPVSLEGEQAIKVPIIVKEQEYFITCLSMGNPHAVVFVKDTDSIKLSAIGPLFESHSFFPLGVNTEFVQVIDKHNLKMRVWERGSGETLSCGTGACAAAVAAVVNGFCQKNDDITVHLPGGKLTICYTDNTVFLTGECKKVFEGTVEV